MNFLLLKSLMQVWSVSTALNFISNYGIESMTINNCYQSKSVQNINCLPFVKLRLEVIPFQTIVVIEIIMWMELYRLCFELNLSTLKIVTIHACNTLLKENGCLILKIILTNFYSLNICLFLVYYYFRRRTSREIYSTAKEMFLLFLQKNNFKKLKEN